jgi:hypothetical protein
VCKLIKRTARVIELLKEKIGENEGEAAKYVRT